MMILDIVAYLFRPPCICFFLIPFTVRPVDILAGDYFLGGGGHPMLGMVVYLLTVHGS